MEFNGKTGVGAINLVVKCIIISTSASDIGCGGLSQVLPLYFKCDYDHELHMELCTVVSSLPEANCFKIVM